MEGGGNELKSGFTGNWAKRYFAVQDSVFTISPKPGLEATSTVILTSARVELIDDTDVIAITTPDRALFVRVDADLPRWLEVLSSRSIGAVARDGACQTLSGLWQKKGQKEIIVSSKKKRWFVLSNGYLRYYPSQKDAADGIPLGVIGLRNAVIERPSDPLSLIVVCDPATPYTRRLEMTAESASTVEAWSLEMGRFCRHAADAAAALPGGDRCLMSGWLTKRGRVVSSWKKRFFILDKSSLRYFRSSSSEDLVLALGSVLLEDAVVEAREGGFNIITPARTLSVKCDLQKEADRWISEIRRCAGQAMVAIEEQPRKFTGWLTKRGRKLLTWQKRWCVCENRCLSYYETNDETGVPSGVLHLKGCTVRSVADFDKYGRDNCFEVTSFGRVLVVQADHAGMVQEWIEVIREHSTGRGRVVMKPAHPPPSSSSPPSSPTPSPLTGDDTTSTLSPLGARPDAYQLIHIIGRGGFGKVFLVKDKSLGGQSPLMAMKTLQKVRLVAAKQVKYVVEERNIMSIVSAKRHPFILSLLRSFQTPQKLYMVLEFSPGGELRHRMFKFGGSFPVDIVRFVAAELFCALEFLHSLDIAHRDIKTENVLLDGEGHVKLCDFGLARHVAHGTRLKSFVGTPEYLAPEIVAGSGHGKEVDWWAFGILIFECLVGETPFIGATPENTYQRIMHETPHFPPSLPTEARDLVAQLLTSDPTARIGPAMIRKHAFFRGIGWERLIERKIKSPLRPGAARKNAFLNNFDPSYIAMPAPRDSMCAVPPQADVQVAMMENFEWEPAADAAEPMAALSLAN